jgi:hypothetical protein
MHPFECAAGMLIVLGCLTLVFSKRKWLGGVMIVGPLFALAAVRGELIASLLAISVVILAALLSTSSTRK